MPDTTPPAGRIFALLPIPYGSDWGYWNRDLGLIVRTLRDMGYDAWLVAIYSEKGTRRDGEPVITATLEQLHDPAWWKSQNPAAAILNLWGASRWDGIRAAARQATPLLLEKLDTAGIFSPRHWFLRYIYEGYWQSRDSGTPAAIAAMKNFFRACILFLLPGMLDKKRVACLSRMRAIAAETPVAAERTRLYMQSFGSPHANVLCIPHPVDTGSLSTQHAAPEKENIIISVGRWQSYQKNFPLLMQVLPGFLASNPEWSADILGALPADAGARLASLPPDVASRIRLRGPLPHAELGDYYRRAKIFLMSSRFESFNIAAAESLCCGCSVVGSPHIASIPFFTGRNSGTPAANYSAGALLAALETEAAAWAQGRRDPATIAADWKNLVSEKAVARKALEALEI